jgi:hypothetical protein
MISGETIPACVARNVVRHKNPVADLAVSNAFADFGYDASHFVAENNRRLLDAIPFENVRAANATGHDFDKKLAGADLRFRPFFKPDVAVSVVYRGSHSNTCIAR